MAAFNPSPLASASFGTQRPAFGFAQTGYPFPPQTFGFTAPPAQSLAAQSLPASSLAIQSLTVPGQSLTQPALLPPMGHPNAFAHPAVSALGIPSLLPTLPVPPGAGIDQFSPGKITLFSDIDGTWKGKSEQGRWHLQNWVNQLGNILNLVFVTGRPESRTHLENQPGDERTFPLIRPAFKIVENGAVIINTALKRFHLPTLPVMPGTHQPGTNATESHAQDPQWDGIQRQSGFNKALIKNTAQKLGQSFGMKPTEIDDTNMYPEKTPHKMSLLIPLNSIPLTEQEKAADVLDDDHFKAPQSIQTFVEGLKQQLQQLAPNMQYVIQPPYITELKDDEEFLFIDIAAPTANKGTAINYMKQAYGLNPNWVIVAGNSGNDISMMENDGRRVIIVGDDSQLRTYAQKLPRDRVIYIDDPSQMPYAIAQHIQTIQAEEQQKALQQQAMVAPVLPTPATVMMPQAQASQFSLAAFA